MKLNLKRVLAAMLAAILCALLSAGIAETESPQNSHIVYLYVPACESCARAVDVLESLPGSVTLSESEVSAVSIERIDISAQPEIARKLFSAYSVSDDERITPCVFFGEYYLSGIESMERDLADMVAAGKAVGEVRFSDETESSDAAAVSAAGAVGAGLIAGLNTCALSMLLLFLSLILEMRKNAGLFVTCFLGAKFVCYLLIGFVLLEIMQRFNPYWLQPLAKGVLTVMGAILIALNLWDAWQAHRENYGKIRNQLPASIRGRLHRMIKGMTRTKVLIPAVIALGFLVALGEFLCAGQLFLMQLLAGIQADAGQQAFNLLIYSIAFIAPSAALCALVLRGGSHVRISAFLAKHMVAAKLITAAAMLALILLAWLL